MVDLYYRTYGSGYPLIALHGLYASYDSWLPLVPYFKDDYQLILPDLRNHGQSPHTDKHTYKLMSEDVIRLMDKLEIATAVLIGHSMGGKVAMQLTYNYPERVSYLVVEDISPFSYLHHPSRYDHERIVETLLSINLTNGQSRKEVEETLIRLLNDKPLALFLLKNLQRMPDGTFRWRMNLRAIANNFYNINSAVTIAKPIQTPSLFIRGSASSYIRPEDEESIKKLFPNAYFACIENGTHWLHAISTTQFVDIVKQRLLLLN